MGLWEIQKPEAGLDEKPTTPLDKRDGFMVYRECKWGGKARWNPHWRNYYTLWSALRFGTVWWSGQPHYILDVEKNEIVYKSWEDENPYAVGGVNKSDWIGDR